mmetsp:Transcript_18209/g.53197  ORF Transcript_18209/g.53197 Transcript_18209/m.53197 type:complete len:217 (-) Transcript_18209:1163-1813(-)
MSCGALAWLTAWQHLEEAITRRSMKAWRRAARPRRRRSGRARAALSSAQQQLPKQRRRPSSSRLLGLGCWESQQEAKESHSGRSKLLVVAHRRWPRPKTTPSPRHDETPARVETGRPRPRGVKLNPRVAMVRKEGSLRTSYLPEARGLAQRPKHQTVLVLQRTRASTKKAPVVARCWKPRTASSMLSKVLFSWRVTASQVRWLKSGASSRPKRTRS